MVDFTDPREVKRLKIHQNPYKKIVNTVWVNMRKIDDQKWKQYFRESGKELIVPWKLTRVV